MASVLFVCMGNICRSPSAEGVFRALLEKHRLTEYVEVDSAGTDAYHVGQPPDKRSIEAAAKRGIDISGLTARQFNKKDFEKYHYILVSDKTNELALKNTAEGFYHPKIELLLNYARNTNIEEIPDPYSGGEQGFEQVLDLLEDACHGLLDHLKQNHLIS